MVAGGRDVTAVKRPTIRLGYVLELVATAAVCFAVVRSQLTTSSVNSPSLDVRRSSDWVRLLGGSILTGMALAGGVGLAVETVRGRRPASWGLGRWIWSIATMFMVFFVASSLAGWRSIDSSARTGCPRSAWRSRAYFERIAIHQFFGAFAWTIAAVCTTAMLARSPRDPEPDAREWAGRLFASVAVALNIAEPLLRAAGR